MFIPAETLLKRGSVRALFTIAGNLLYTAVLCNSYQDLMFDVKINITFRFVFLEVKIILSPTRGFARTHSPQLSHT